MYCKFTVLQFTIELTLELNISQKCSINQKFS